MSAPTVFQNDVIFNGAVGFSAAPTFPAGAISDGQIASGSSIAASKIISHRQQTVSVFKPGTTIAATTQAIMSALANGTLMGFQAWIETVTADAGRITTIDLKKSTAGGAYATVLSAPLSFASTTTVRNLYTATVNASTYTTGDLFKIVTTVSGSSGSQSAGLGATVTFEQRYS